MGSDVYADENKMGVMPVGKLLFTMAAPLTVSLMVQALYNVIDSLFLSHLGENVLAAISLAATVQNFMSSMAAGLGVGANALVTSYLGKRDRKKASEAALCGIWIEFVCMLFFFFAGLFLVKQYFLFQTDHPEIVGYGTAYLRICMAGSLGMFGEIIFERLLQSAGKTVCTMITQGTGAVVNILLDAALIFGVPGILPAMGIRGAAAATVCGQWIAMGLALWLNVRENRELSFRLKGFRPDPDMTAAILRVGIPSAVAGSVGSFMFFLLNRLIASFSTTALAVFGIYNRLQHFILTPMIGITNSVVSVAAYNYGARKKKRITDTFRWGMIYGSVMMTFAAFCFLLFPEAIMAPFHPTEEMLAVGIPIFRIVGFTFVFSPLSMINCSLFQGLGNGGYSLVVTVARQILIRVPLAYLFALSGDLSLVWYCWPVSEVCSDLISLALLRRMYKKVLCAQKT